MKCGWLTLLETNNFSNGYFRLRINDLDGNYKISAIIKVNGYCEKLTYSIMPNPVQKYIEVLGLKIYDAIAIFDMAGKKVLYFASPLRRNRFDIQNLPSGMYILQVNNRGVIKTTTRFTKN